MLFLFHILVRIRFDPIVQDSRDSESVLMNLLPRKMSVLVNLKDRQAIRGQVGKSLRADGDDL